MGGVHDEGASALLSPPSEADAAAVGLAGEGEVAASPRVDLAYEPRYQR